MKKLYPGKDSRVSFREGSMGNKIELKNFVKTNKNIVTKLSKFSACLILVKPLCFNF